MNKRTGKAALAAILAVTAMLAAIPVYAADTKQTGDLNLGISKDATYVLTIPSSTDKVEFGAENTSIGDLVISGDLGTKQKVTVIATKEAFKDEKDADNTITFALKNGNEEFTTADWTRTDIKESKRIALNVNIPAATWDTAAPGTYKGKITFSADILEMK